MKTVKVKIKTAEKNAVWTSKLQIKSGNDHSFLHRFMSGKNLDVNV